jgi:dihydropteroate synthase-like protein
MISGLEAGAVVGMSVLPHLLDKVPRHVAEEKGFVVLVNNPSETSKQILRKHTERGWKLIVDPVMYPSVYPGTLPSLMRAYTLKKEVKMPILLGINNVYELMDADTTGTIPLLTALSAEAGASILLVTEQSDKAKGSLLEARIAADLISLSLYYSTPPKDYPLRLLVAKQKRLCKD